MLPEDFFNQLSRHASRRLRFTPERLNDLSVWSDEVREKLGALLRSDLWPDGALDVRVTEREEREGYTRERIEFSGGLLFTGSAYLLIPSDCRGSVPGILCFHGHGGYMAGKDMVAGVEATHPIARECAEALNYGYGVQLARAGFVTLCPDAFNFGERLLAEHRWAKHACDEYFKDLLLHGYNQMGVTVGTNLRLIDYLLTRPEVAPGGVGCIGLSYGGMQVIYTMAMDLRVRAGVVSGALHSKVKLQASAKGSTSCGAQIIPGLLEWFDLDDLAKSLAPRPVYYELMRRDGCFDFDKCVSIYRQIEDLYRSLGVPERTGLNAPDTDHRYDGTNIAEFFAAYLD